MGLAYLQDGTIIDYDEYVNGHPHWQKVRKARFEFDGGRCAICHRDLRGDPYQTHHLSYHRLGRERMRDVITLCEDCHHNFHRNWTQLQFWKGKESGHWEVYDLQHTAQLCLRYWRQDKYISRDPDGPNLCNQDACRQLLDTYFKDAELTTHPIIDPYDISLFIRNKRYELFFEAEGRGLTVEGFLNEYYGPKARGSNPLRQEAGRKKGPFDHTAESFHRHYAENKNINELMKLVTQLEEEKHEQA